MSKIAVKTTFEAQKTIQPIYTGGSVSLDASGRLLATCVGEDALVVDLETGERLAQIEGDGELITSIILSPNGSHLAICSRSLSMRFYTLKFLDESSRTIEAHLTRSLKPHTTPVVTTAIDPTSSLLATGSADGSIKLWDLQKGYTTHTFHGHGGVISALCFFEIQVKGLATKEPRFKNIPKDASDLPESLTSGFRLASGSEDGKIRIWDLHKKKSVASLNSHVSVVRSLSFSKAGNTLLSASRDKTVIVWDAETWECKRIMPVVESVEAAGFISDGPLCYLGGENGRLRVWDSSRGSEVTEDQSVGSEQESVVTIQYFEGLPFILTVHVDQSLKLHSLDPLSSHTPGVKIQPLPLKRQIAGNDDEVIDMACVGRDRSLLALATNSEYIRIVRAQAVEGIDESQNHFGADVARLEGHEEIIICLDVDWSGNWLITGAKDNSARLWRIDPGNSSFTCFATFTGHAESLGAVAFPRAAPAVGTPAFEDPLNHPPPFFFSGSQDRTIKRWDTSKLNATAGSKVQAPKALYTRKAHEKDINAIDVNYSSTLFASASQDRTAKIWSVEDGSVTGVLRGHKRGVWSIRFAPKDTPISSTAPGANSRGLVATGSGDKTVKLWSLSDYSCLLTFEGHANSVLKVLWLPPPRISQSDEDISSRGAAQTSPLIASAGADGLVKIWSPITGEVETTLDNHTDRVWALATPYSLSSGAFNQTSSRESDLEFSLISGAADSVVTFWKDTTSSTLSAAVSASSARVEEDQKLQNYIHAGAYREAITLALRLNHPGRLLSLFTNAIDANDDTAERGPDNLTGNPDIDAVLKELDHELLYMLLIRLRDWNTNARTARVAQRILYALFRSYPSSTFIELASQKKVFPTDGSKPEKSAAMKDILDALAAYTERHYRRVEDLVDESYLVEWVLGEMDGGVGIVAPVVNGAEAEDVIMI